MTPPRIAVTVAYAAPGVEALLVVTLPAGATVNDAIAQSGIAVTLALDLALLQFAIFGQRAKGETPLANGDRVELTRPLIADPGRARRKRAADRARPGSDPRAKPRG